MARAVCIRCGRPKGAFIDACSGCGFDPEAEGLDAQTRSAFLSIARVDAAHRGEYERELDVLGARLSRGESIDFVAEDLARMRDLLLEGKGWKLTSSLRLVALGFLWLGAPIICVLVLIVVLSRC